MSSSPETPETTNATESSGDLTAGNSSAKAVFGAVAGLGIGAGLLAGFASFGLGSWLTYSEDIAAVIYNVNANIDFEEVDRQNRNILLGNTTFASAMAGLLLVAAIGFGKNWFVSTAAAVKATGIGALAGLVAGAIGGLLGVMAWQYLVDNEFFWNPNNDTSTHAAIGNAIIWSLIGGTAGVLFCKNKVGAVVGVVGGVLGAGLFMLVVLFALTAVQADVPLPGDNPDSPWRVARLLWAVIPSATIALFIGRTLIDEHSTPKELAADETEPS